MRHSPTITLNCVRGELLGWGDVDGMTATLVFSINGASRLCGPNGCRVGRRICDLSTGRDAGENSQCAAYPIELVRELSLPLTNVRGSEIKPRP